MALSNFGPGFLLFSEARPMEVQGSKKTDVNVGNFQTCKNFL